MAADVCVPEKTECTEERAHAYGLMADAVSKLSSVAGIDAEAPRLILVKGMAHAFGMRLLNASKYDARYGTLHLDELYVDDFHTALGVAQHNLNILYSSSRSLAHEFNGKRLTADMLSAAAPALFAYYYQFRGLPEASRTLAVVSMLDTPGGSLFEAYDALRSSFILPWGIDGNVAFQHSALALYLMHNGFDFSRTFRAIFGEGQKQLLEDLVAYVKQKAYTDICAEMRVAGLLRGLGQADARP